MASAAATVDDPGTIARNVRALVGFVAPTTILTALFLYFGYVWTDSFYEYFGIDAATLQFSPQDYMLRSVQAIYVPVGAMLLLALLFAWAQPSMVVFVLRRRHAAWWSMAWRTLLGVGVALLAAGVLLVLLPVGAGSNSMLAPLFVAAGVLVVGYCRVLSALHRRGRTRRVAGRERTSAGLVLALVTLCLFWCANSFAQQYGRGTAIDLGNSLQLRPAVILDTTEELFLQLPGVTESTLPAASADQAFHFRYRGLRLLAQSGSRMFFVSSAWSPRTGRTLMVTTGDDIRVQFAAG